MKMNLPLVLCAFLLMCTKVDGQDCAKYGGKSRSCGATNSIHPASCCDPNALCIGKRCIAPPSSCAINGQKVQSCGAGARHPLACCDSRAVCNGKRCIQKCSAHREKSKQCGAGRRHPGECCDPKATCRAKMCIVPPVESPPPEPTPSTPPVQTSAPIVAQTAGPTSSPTAGPTSGPTAGPTYGPTAGPTYGPTTGPTYGPTAGPTSDPATGPTPMPAPFSPSPTPPTSPATYTCPPVGSSPLKLVALQTYKVVLSIASVDTLCTLVQLAPDGSHIRPVGRSYASFDWEPYAGTYDSLLYSCSDTSCTVDLPPLKEGYSYILTSYARTPFSTKDEAARFLEQTTFGPTWDEIEGLSSVGSYPDWITEQISLPVSSHRQFLRERSNANYEASNYQSLVTSPCQKGTRYRKYAFTKKDRLREVVIETTSSGKRLLIGGQARTVIKGDIHEAENIGNMLQDGIYVICKSVDQIIGGQLFLKGSNLDCKMVSFNGVIGNPEVNFYQESTDITNANEVVNLGELGDKVISIDTVHFGNSNQELFVDTPLVDTACAVLHSVHAVSPERVVVGKMGSSDYWLHMSMWDTLDNTLEQPLEDGGGSAYELTVGLGGEQDRYETRCSNAPRTFLNEDYCTISTLPNACTEIEVPDIRIPLNTTTFRQIYNMTNSRVNIYAITGLRQDSRYVEYPCTPGTRSRWIPSENCSSDVSIEQSTGAIFADLLVAQSDMNPYLRDVIFPDSGTYCAEADRKKFDFKTTVSIDGACWLNVHPEHRQVRDFTDWVHRDHPGGRNPIEKETTDIDIFVLPFPSWHDMGRWHKNFGRLPNLGRYGDEVKYKDLPVGLQRSDIAEYFGEVVTSTKADATLICGSPYEVANDLQNYGNLERGGFDIATRHDKQTSGTSFERQRVTTWLMQALASHDQLRQKVAWALSQILVVSPGSIDRGYDKSEAFITYYDIFVRNAFGNYRDIIREVSYSPLMGEMLSYLQSQSTGYIWTTQRRWEFADENYAREIMQLFSIGLYALNPDGTHVKQFNQSVSTYTNNDITEYARVWTGFKRRASRGNIEQTTSLDSNNMVDPMEIDIDWRDHYPKLGFQNQYIGDGWPLCNDLPSKHFLRKGAVFQVLGSSSNPQVHLDPSGWVGGSPTRFALPLDSKLRQKLCNNDNNNQETCDHQVKITLDVDLPCIGVECRIDTLRTFLVNDIFYEYVRPACVNLAFSTNSKVVKLRSDEAGFMCADPTTETASTTCCNSTAGDESTRREVFSGERVSYDTASGRCESEGLSLCERPQVNDCAAGVQGCDNSVHYWTRLNCQLRVKVNRDGSVAMVHQPKDSRVFSSHVSGAVQEDTKSFFRVEWLTSVFALLQPANYETQCSEIGCSLSTDGFCLCDATVSSTPAFTTPPSRDEVLEDLHYGAVPPISTRVVEVAPGVKLHSDTDNYTEDSIFEVVDDNGTTQWRKNLKSQVQLGNSNGPIFRNPVHFIALSDPEPRDAQYETEAAIDHYLYHPNTAPFIGTRLAQRFGISNPSPRYVAAIADAFRTGRYSVVEGGSTSEYGTGQYGDLAATTAAVLLDREARTTLLDADPMHGSLQEPFLKFVRLMRSLEFVGQKDYPLIEINDDLQELIGQEAYKFPSVFSFFKPEYQPPGVVSKAGLVSPESQILSGPKVINMMNAMLSFIKYGASSCYEGVFRSRGGRCEAGSFDISFGNVTYAPSSSTPTEVVNDLATLLTSGRLSQENRLVMEQAYADTIAAKGDSNLANINVQQLITTTAEFHTTGTVTKTGVSRPNPEPIVPSDKPYKAVIFLMLEGGYDSFNMLVPETCTGTNANGDTVREQYDQERGNLAFQTGVERSVRIDVDGTSDPQPCSQFALHDELTLLQQLYNDKELLFLANVGNLDESGMDKTNWEDLTVSQVFSHNSMQEEAKKIDPFGDAPGTGILGRASDVLVDQGYSVDLLSIDDASVAVDGTPGVSKPPVVVSRKGVPEFNRIPYAERYFDTSDYINRIHNQTSAVASSIFGEMWSDQLLTGIRQVESLSNDFKNATLSDVWADNMFSASNSEEEEMWRRFNTIAKLIATRDRRGVDRDFFYTAYGGWDHHRNMKDSIRPKFKTLNYALKLLVSELKTKGLWESTTIVVASDFARTITPNNSKGSDHGWGGNYFMMGGSVEGGRILGDYPDDLTADGPLNIGRGRILPTLSWDAVWRGVVEWAGVPEDQLGRCLPNESINGPFFLNKEELYK